MRKKMTKAENFLEQITETLQEKIDEKNAQINVFTAKAKMPVVNQFVLLFYQSFLHTIDEYNLSRNEIRCLLKILEYTQFGNLIQLSFAKVGKDLNINRANISRIIKKLKEAKLLMDDDGNMFLNPQIIAKGNFLKKDDEESEKLLNLGAELSCSAPNIMTKFLKAKSKKKEVKNRYEQTSLLDDLE